MEYLLLFLLLVGFVLIIWGLISFVRGIFTNPTAVSSTRITESEIDGMNEGDYYNGPHGYSPMTGYPETQYGSGFDEDAEWHEER